MGAEIRATGKPIRTIFDATRSVPTYQRDYSWQPKRQVKALWEDITTHLEQTAEDDYLLGPIIVTKDPIPEIIDGQQRLITLHLLQAAFRYRLKQLGGDQKFIGNIEAGLVEYDESSSTTVSRIRHHDPLAQSELTRLASLDPAVDDASAIKSDNVSISRRRIVFAFRHLLRSVDELGSDVKVVDERIRLMRSRVKLIEIETEDAAQAIYVFERANFRGKPLDPSDLLKNLIFQQYKGDFDVLGEDWRRIQHAIDSANGVQIMDFLRWYHMGAEQGFYATSRDFVQKVQDFVKQQDPQEYVRSMIVSSGVLHSMANDASLGVEDGYSPALAGIRVMSGGRQKAHWPVMMATSSWGAPTRMLIASELERVMFYSLVCEIRSQEVERKMRSITVKTRDGELQSSEAVLGDLRALAAEYYKDHFFKDRFLQLSLEDDSHVVRYVLKKIHDGLYREFDGRSAAGADAASRDFSESEVEHIWPQADGDELATEEDPALVHRIGNLTLLSRAINASGGKKRAEKKITDVYPQEDSKYLIATALAGRPSMTGNHSRARAVALCPTGFEAWDASSIGRLAEDYLVLLERYVPAPPAAMPQDS